MSRDHKEKRKKKHLYSIYISHRFFTKFKSFEARIVDEGGMKWDACHTCNARSSSSYRNSLELSVEIPSVQIFNATYPASQTDLLFWQWYDTLCPTISRDPPCALKARGGIRPFRNVHAAPIVAPILVNTGGHQPPRTWPSYLANNRCPID